VIASAVLIVGADAVVDRGMSSGRHPNSLPERLGGKPFACLDILGKSLLSRTIAFLEGAGVGHISVVADRSICHRALWFPRKPVEVALVDRADEVWPRVERKIEEHADDGVETVLVARLGAYVEFELADVLQFHSDCGQLITRVWDKRGPWDFWIVGARAARPPGSLAWGSASGRAWRSAVPYFPRGYINPLSDVSDLRRLVVDAFLGRCGVRPSGIEARPGIWIDEGARVDRGARIVAPAYIGTNTRIRAAAVITRFSSVEHDCRVDCGTVVEDACILPYTYLGQWLDVSHSVVDGGTFINLQRNVAVEIADPALISTSLPFPAALGGVAEVRPAHSPTQFPAPGVESKLEPDRAWLPGDAEPGGADAVA
jgi:hypothetical protein